MKSCIRRAPRTTLLTVALATAALVATANRALAMRDPGPGPDPAQGGGMALYEYGSKTPAAAAPQPPRIGQNGANSQYADGMSLYEYVRSTPQASNDPLGLSSKAHAHRGKELKIYRTWVRVVEGKRTFFDPGVKCTCDEGDPSDPAVYALDEHSQLNCCLQLKMKCRVIQHWTGTFLRVKHCYLEVQTNKGQAIATITAGPSGPGATGTTRFNPDGDLHRGGDEYDFNLRTPTGVQSACKFIACAYPYAVDISDQYKYDHWTDNSNTFIERIIRKCGGEVLFPTMAVGAKDVVPPITGILPF